MVEHEADQERCFNCARAESEIPLIAWRFRAEPLWVCSECMPLLIHKWPQVAATLAASNQSDS